MKNISEIFLDGQNQDLSFIRQNMSDPIEANYIPLQSVRSYAMVEFGRMKYDESFWLFPGNYQNISPATDPVVVYDESGRYRLYYRFSATNPDGQDPFIFIAASKVFGNPILREGIGSGNESGLIRKGQEIIDANYPHYTINSAKILTNCWGQVIRIDLIDPITDNETILTIDYWGIVEERNCGMEIGTLSPMEISDNITVWEKKDAYYRAILEKADLEGINLSAPYSAERAKRMEEIFPA